MNVQVIFGPPGTGKTTVLQGLLVKELRNYSVNEMAYVSFTREGVNQGKQRVKKRLSLTDSDMPYFRTLHSIAFHANNMQRSNVISKRYYKMFSDKMGMSFTGYYTEEFHNTDDMYLFFNILHRNNPRTAANYLTNIDTNVLSFVAKNYRAFKKHYGLLDFTDMIQGFVKKNESLPVKVAFIDEAQDLTTLQWAMIWVAFRDCDKVYIAGDDDQAIYEWSGADVNYFLSIDGDTRILDRSYRLPNRILAVAKNISSYINTRIEKDYTGTGNEGEVHVIARMDEIRLTGTKESWMFLCRNRVFLKDVIAYVRRQKVVYTYNKVLSVKPEKIRAINTYEHCRKTHVVTDDDRTALFQHITGTVNFNSPWYSVFNWDSDTIMYYRDLIESKVNLKKCNVIVDTIHSVKGGEADNVVILSDITKRVKENVDNNPDSEHRVYYVGATRAKRRLFVVNAHSTYAFPLHRYTRSML